MHTSEQRLQEIWRDNLRKFNGNVRLDSIIIRAMQQVCDEQKIGVKKVDTISKDDIVNEIYESVFHRGYRLRHVMKSQMKDSYYSGYLDCFDKYFNNEP